MDIDLTKCVFGDRLKTRDGKAGIYLDNEGTPPFVHRVAIDGRFLLKEFQNDGCFWKSRTHHLDITEIFPREQPAQKWPKPCCGDVPDELKCPWCESTYVLPYHGDPITGDAVAFCICENCGLSGPTFDNLEQAKESFRLLKRSDKP